MKRYEELTFSFAAASHFIGMMGGWSVCSK